MRRLYSSETDGRSFNRLEWAVLGYDGPTLLTVKTASGDIIGAFTQKPWKDALNYYGSGDSFLFQLSPELKILWSTGPQNHFMFMHSGKFTSPVKPSVDGLPHGIGFGGGLSSKPRFFIPESFENCSAQFLDKTFETGDILPESALERFEINVMEIWGVGSDETIEHSIERRKEHRIHTEEAIHRARSVNDKTQFVKDLKSGFTPSKLYEHLDVARGRHEFRVDDKHGGYKVDHV